MRNTQGLLGISVAYFGIIATSLFLYFSTGAELFLFAPLFIGIFFIGITPGVTNLGIIIVYIGFDGLFKILSSYNPILHVGADILVVILTLKFLAEMQIGRYDQAKPPPLWPIIIVHVTWVAVEIFNPFGAGFLAGIASYKYYLSFVMLYVYAYIFITRVEEVQALMWITILIAVLQVVTSVMQFRGGESFMIAMSPNYANVMMNRFVGDFFRPFGTSNMPGGGSTYIFMTMPIMFALMFISKNLVTRLVIASVMIGCSYVLFISQVRAAVIKSFFGILFFIVVSFWRRPVRVIWSLVLVAGLWYIMQTQFGSERTMGAQSRFSTLTDIETLAQARAGWDFLERIIVLVQEAPFGIGLSRVGGASQVFYANRKDQFYGPIWSFTDNLFLSLIVELGIPGTIFFLILAYIPFFKGIRGLFKIQRERLSLKFTLAACLAVVFACITGHYGAEGLLALPESGYYWLFLGCAMTLLKPEFRKYR